MTLTLAALLVLLARNVGYTGGMLAGRRDPPPPTDRPWPRPTVIIPAYDEAAVLGGAVRAALAADPAAVVIVDDGSTDDTAAVADRLAADDPRVRVVRSDRNRGKAAALNLGVAVAETDWVVCIDADTHVAADALTQLMAVAHARDAVAVAGRIDVGNDDGLLGRAQAIEYALECERRHLQLRLGLLTTIPGALGAFYRPAFESVGGSPDDTLIEDTGLTLRLIDAGARIAYAPRARARTEAPSTLRGWWRQRDRWSAGFISIALRRAERATAARLLVDELLAPLAAPALFVAAGASLTPVGAVALAASTLAVLHTELVVALGDRYPRRRPGAALALLGYRVAYAGLRTLHLASLLPRLALRRRIQWNRVPRTGIDGAAPPAEIGPG